MSKASVVLRKWLKGRFGKEVLPAIKNPLEILEDVVGGDLTEEIQEKVAILVDLLDDAADEYLDRKDIIAAVIETVVRKRIGKRLPGWLVNGVIEMILAQLRLGQEAPTVLPGVPEASQPSPQPVPPTRDDDPSHEVEPAPPLYNTIFYTLPNYWLYQKGDRVYVDNYTAPSKWYVKSVEDRDLDLPEGFVKWAWAVI